MCMAPQARHFPRRNRIISGLSRATIVIEAAAKSGSLITARTALDQGRDVMAVPGHPFDARASGCNMLIRDGAVLVRGADDVLAALQTPATATKTPQSTKLKEKNDPHLSAGDLPDRILSQLGPTPVSEDQLIRDLGRPTAEVSSEISALELDGKIKRDPGGLLSRVA